MSNISGKLIIIGIVTVALVAAGTSWWFRYNATRQSAEFWGPDSAKLIRDAPIVELGESKPPMAFQLPSDSLGVGGFLDTSHNRDISKARGLVHLRNALLVDRSYRWPPRPLVNDAEWKWILIFRDPTTGEAAILLFTPDCKTVTTMGRPREFLLCEPIADGLAEMFTEIAGDRPPAR